MHKELTPKLRFPEFKEKLEIKKLGELLEFKNGINASKEQYGRGIKFINVLDILSNDYITYENIIGFVDIDSQTLEKYSVNYGDVLFQRSSETREEVGSANVYLDRNNTATFGGFVIRGKKIGEYNPAFLNKLLKSDFVRDEITSKSGGSTRYNVGQETLSSVFVALPSLPEQEKIASFLTAIDDKIQALTKKKELLEQYKKGVMHKIFNQEIRFMDVEGNDFPEWEEKLLGELTHKVHSGKDKHHSKGKYDLYGSTGVIGKSMVASFCGSYILIARVGANAGSINLVQGKFGVTDNTIVVDLVEKASVNFFFYLLFYTNLSKLVFGSGQPLITASHIKAVKLALPTTSEQERIGHFLSSLDKKIAKVGQQVKLIQAYKKGLMQQMFV